MTPADGSTDTPSASTPNDAQGLDAQGVTEHRNEPREDRQADAQRAARTTRLIAASVAILVTALIALLATRPDAAQRTPGSPLVGQLAPPVKGTAIDGRFVDLEHLRGRYVVLNFFATWCGPCRQEHPEMKAFSEKYAGPQDPTIVAVVYDSNDVTNARSFFAQYGGGWPVLGDDGSKTAVDYGVRGLPESFVIDPEGKIKARITGALTSSSLEALTERT